MFNKITIGTAQFGMPYGISNDGGQVSSKEIERILDLAESVGIDSLDTAISYGQSESMLGRHDLDGFSVITKLPMVTSERKDVTKWVIESIEESLRKLNLSSLDGVLLHKPSQLLDRVGPELYSALLELKNKGLAKRIGISIYAPAEIPALIENFAFDLIQAPYSILDHRLSDSGWLHRLHTQGVSIHVRSIFLQGLLLMPKSMRPVKFRKWRSIFECWDRWLEETGQDALTASLSYVLSRPEIEKIVLGVHSTANLEEILESVRKNNYITVPDSFSNIDTQLLDPSQWKDL